MKNTKSWVLVVLMVAFLLVAAFGEAGGIELALQTDGNVWATLTTREKGIMVSGIVTGIVAATYAEAGARGPAEARAVFMRNALPRSLSQMVRRLDAFYSAPDHEQCSIGLALLLQEAEGAQEIADDILALPADWK